jgi:hypothetical protein
MFETDPDRWRQSVPTEWQPHRIAERIRGETKDLIRAIRAQAPAFRLALKASWHLPILIRNVLLGLVLGLAISGILRVLGGPGGQGAWMMVPPTLGIAVWLATVVVAVMRQEGLLASDDPVSDLEIDWQGPDEVAEMINSLTQVQREIEGRGRSLRPITPQTHPVGMAGLVSRSLGRRPFLAFGHVPLIPPRLG